MAGTTEGAIKSTAIRWGITAEEYTRRIENGEQRCTKCKRWKLADAFCSDRSRVRSRAMKCRECANGRKRPGPSVTERQQRRAFGLEWCCLCESWLPANKVRAGLCRPHTNQLDRERYAKDATYRAERKQHAHSRKRALAPIPVSGQEMILAIFEGRCAYCSAPATTWDHIVPVSQGGKTVPWNIVPACASCNSRKRAKPLDEWLDSCQDFNERVIDTISLEYMPIATG